MNNEKSLIALDLTLANTTSKEFEKYSGDGIYNSEAQRVGVITGKFAPLHTGQIYAITEASTQVDHLYVILSYDDKFFDTLKNPEYWRKHMSKKKRLLWLKRTFQHFDHITIICIDETKIKTYPEGVTEWCDNVKKLLLENNVSSIDKWFSSEPEYSSWINEYFGEAEHVVIDQNRETFNISATEIRQNVYDYWEYLPSIVRKEFLLKVVLIGQESCVDCDTQFFNGKEWKYISEYKSDDMVLQYDMNDGCGSLVYPSNYIKEPCKEFIKFTNMYGTWSQVVSEDHNMVYRTHGKLVKTNASIIESRHIQSNDGFCGQFITSFNMSGDFNMNHDKLRLLIAISADGSKVRNKWRIRVKKDRKKDRMRKLILNCGLELDERIYNDDITYSNFYVPLDFGCKLFPVEFYNFDTTSKNVFCEEVLLWDGTTVTKTDAYFTTLEHNLNIVQFLFSSIGYKTSSHVSHKNRERPLFSLYICNTKYRTICVNPKLFPNRKNSLVTRIESKDGFKYCFTVDTGALILRRDGEIFITGNCAKSTLTIFLAKMFNTSWVEEYGRLYCENEMCGDESLLSFDDYGIIASNRFYDEQQAVKTANKVLFVDTDAFITQYYCEMYEGKKHPLVDAYIDQEEYDVILHLSNEVKWVDDGLRINSDREKSSIIFDKLLKDYDINNHKGYNYIQGNYHQRLNESVKIVKEYLKQTYIK